MGKTLYFSKGKPINRILSEEQSEPDFIGFRLSNGKFFIPATQNSLNTLLAIIHGYGIRFIEVEKKEK